jgi:hypothetical protein
MFFEEPASIRTDGGPKDILEKRHILIILPEGSIFHMQ